MNVELNSEDIRTLLDDLSAELASGGARADLFLVGGTASAVARRRGLATDWLNDAVKGFLPGPDPDAERFYTSDSLIVDVASPRYLLAMKLFSSRVESDVDDIMFLYRQLGFTTVEQGLDLVEGVYQGRAITPKVQFLLTEIVEELHRQDAE